MNVTYNFRDFQTALKRVSHATSKDDKRPTLMCAQVIGSKTGTRLLAADGFRAAFLSMDPAQEGTAFDIILDPGTIKAITGHKVPKKEDPELVLDMDAGHVTVNSRGLGGFSFNGCGNGTFPDINAVIPKKIKTAFTVSPLPLLAALKSARIFAREGSNVALFHIADSLVISADSEEFGESVSVVDIENRTGPDLLIGFNVDFVIDTLKQAGTDSVKFEFQSPTSPTLITLPDDMQAVIMPMQVRDGRKFTRAEDIQAPSETPTGESYVWPASPRTPSTMEFLSDRTAPDYSELPSQPIILDDWFISTPEPGAVIYDLTGAMLKFSTPEHGKPIPAIELELTNARPDPTAPVPAPIVVYDPRFAQGLIECAAELGVPVEIMAAFDGVPVEIPSRYALLDD